MYLGLDLGTSGVKALLLDSDQIEIAQGSAALTVDRPHPGWSEQNPDDWIRACETAMDQVRSQAPDAFRAILGIAVSGQMHGATLLDRHNKPLRPAILWNDGRAARESLELAASADFEGIAGNSVMAGFTAPKLRWVKKHEPDIFARTEMVLLPKDYVTLWLTGEFVSDVSDASGTLWLDVGRRAWSDELLAATHLSQSHMPRLVESSDAVGSLRPELAKKWGLGPVVIAGGAGDNAATGVGLGLSHPGETFLSLGTSGVLFSVADHFAPNTAGGVHSFCHAVPKTWHQMGVILSATDSLSWFSQLTGKSVPELVDVVTGTGSGPSPVTFLPYLSGERTPHNAPDATGQLLGLRRDHDVSHVVQAIMEGVGFAFADCAQTLWGDSSKPDTVWVAGGGSRSQVWLQIIANITGLTLCVPNVGHQGAALGACRLAAMAHTPDLIDDILRAPVATATFEPDPLLAEKYSAKYDTYKSAWAAQQI